MVNKFPLQHRGDFNAKMLYNLVVPFMGQVNYYNFMGIMGNRGDAPERVPQDNSEINPLLLQLLPETLFAWIS